MTSGKKASAGAATTTGTPDKKARKAAKKAARKAFRAEMRWPRNDKLVRLAWGALAGVLTFLSFPFTTSPDTNLWPLAWVSLVPFLWALRGRPGKPTTARQAFWMGAWVGFVTNFGGFWWVSEVLSNFGHLPWFVSMPAAMLNAFYQGLMWALVAVWWTRAEVRGPLPIWKRAAIFTVVEWLYPMIFPWYLANGQYRFLEGIQIAELGGVMAITFTMVAFNSAVFAIVDWRRRGTELPRRAAILALAGTAAVVVYGAIRVGMVEGDEASAEKFRLGLVEANIGIFEKQAKHLPPREQALTLHRNLLRHQLMSAQVQAMGADLVVWPESSYFPLSDPYIKRSDRFALALTKDGALTAWTDPGPPATHSGLPGGAADRQVTFQWRALPDAPNAGLRAIGAAREDAWGAVGDGGLMLLNGDRKAAGTTANLRAVGVIESLGHALQEDRAPVTLWAAGEGGVLVRREEGGKSVVVPTGVTTALNAVALGGGRTGWIVGDAGVALVIEGDSVRQVSLGTQADLRAVWLDPSGEGALVAGRFGVLTFVDASGKTVAQTLPLGTPAVDFAAIAADARGVVSVGGSKGVVITKRGKAWERDDLPVPLDVVALSSDARGTLLAATSDGRVWRHADAGQAAGAAAWIDTGAAGVVALAPLGYVQTRPLPRDMRYVQQGLAPLPTTPIDQFDPAEDIRDTPDMDRSAIQRGFTAPILLGALTWEDPPADSGKKRKTLYNTAVLVDGLGRILGTYDKVFLLAFGEYMPFGEMFPGLYDMFPAAGRFTAGKAVRTFHWGARNLGIMICYEDIMAGFTAKLADLEPDIIINVTNDAWFGYTAEPYLHLALSVFRSVENRRMLVRSTNTGVSAFIGPTGRIEAQTSMDDPEVLVRDVPLLHGKTVYAAIGDVFVWALLVGLVAEGIWAWRRRRAVATVRASEGGKSA